MSGILDEILNEEQTQKNELLNKRRIVDQSALMQNIDQISKKHKELKNDGTYPFKNIPTGPLLVGFSESEEDPSKDVGLIVNKIYNFKEFIKSYNKLSSADLANLIPYIQIWKIYEDDKEFLIPFNNFYPKASIDAITSNGSDRGFQANLLNLEFISQGKDTATTFIYQVNLNIIFDSVQTLFNENSRYLELFNPPKKAGRFLRGSSDPKYYQIKLKFGWNTNVDLPLNLKPQELKQFADFSGSEIFLNYVKHNITINEDGSVSLKVEYIGSLEMIARDSNKISILSGKKIEKLNSISERIDTITQRLSEQSIQVERETDSDGKTNSVKLTRNNEEIGGLFNSDKNELEKLYKELEENESNGKNEFINGIIKNIAEQYDGYLPFMKINYDSYLKRKNIIQNYTNYNEYEKINNLSEILKLERAKNNVELVFLNNFSLQGNDVDFERYLETIGVINAFDVSGFSTIFPKAFQAGKDLGRSIFGELGLTREQVTAIGTNAAVSEANKEQQWHRIPFFTFGRLLKAIQSLGSEDKESDFIIITGDCKISSFGDGQFIDGKTLSTDPQYKIYIDNGLKVDNNLLVLKNEVQIYNILEIPIALSTFRYWFSKNISSQNLSKMSLINFLNLCVNDLLNMAVKCSNEDYIPKQNLNFKFFFDKVELNNDNKFLTLIKNRQGPAEILNKSDYTGMDDFFLEKQIQNSKSIKKNIIMIYAIPSYMTRKSNLKQDIEDGIPHFYYGQNKGIINKITFREESMPFVREANIQTQVDRKPWKAGVFIRGKYNVLIEMIGTVNFRIGSMIFISPSFPGVINFGEPLEYGIGGYFLIISIKTNIESGKYITSIEALWQSTGTGEYTNLSHLPITVFRLSQPLEESKIEAETEDAKKALIASLSPAVLLGATFGNSDLQQLNDAFKRVINKK